MLEGVDGVVGIGRSGPVERGAAERGGGVGQGVVARNGTGGGAHHVEHIERGHARARFGELEARIREVDACGRGPNGEAQLQTLVFGAGIGHRQASIERDPARIDEQGVLAQALGEDPLGQAGHEHHAELAATRGVGRAHEDAAVAAPGWLVRKGEETRREHGAGLAQGHGTDGTQRRHLGEYTRHARGLAQHAGQQGGERANPLGPGAGGAPAIERRHDRHGKRLEVLQLLAVALEGPQPGRVLILARQFAHAPVVLAAQPGEASLPTRQALDDICLDEQLLPSPRRAQSARHHAVAVALGRGRRFVDGGRIFHTLVRRNEPFRHVTGRSCEGRSFCSAWRCLRASPRYKWRDLAQGEVLGEAAGGQAFVGAREQGEEGTAGGVWTARAALEPGRYAGAGEGVFEQAKVGVRRAQQHGHLVERHAGGRFLQHAPRDLHGLAPFTGRRQHLHRCIERARGRRAGREEPRLQPVERAQRWHRRISARHLRAHDGPTRRQGSKRSLVTRGHRGAHGGGRARDGAHEGALGAVRHGHIEPQHVPGSERTGRRAQPRGSQPHGGGAIHGAGPSSLAFHAGEQRRQVGTHVFHRGQRRRVHARLLQLRQRARQRAREPR